MIQWRVAETKHVENGMNFEKCGRVRMIFCGGQETKSGDCEWFRRILVWNVPVN
jgi:hypothetical protein